MNLQLWARWKAEGRKWRVEGGRWRAEKAESERVGKKKLSAKS
jgi:hypothetical protein